MQAALSRELDEQNVVLQSQQKVLNEFFSPSIQNSLEEEKEKLTFLAKNSPTLLQAFQSLRQKGVVNSSNSAFQENLELDGIQ